MMRWLGLGLVLLLLSGCALQRQVPGTSVAWEQRRADLSALADWDLRGRLAVKSGEQGGQGRMDWQQRAGQARVNVSGPFGIGAYEIRFNASEIVVTDGDGEVAAAYSGVDAAERFLQAQLGWSFPAVNARYWLLGVPAPEQDYREQFDAEGWLVAIEQQGWLVRYDGFKQHQSDWLPRKLTLENPSGRLRLVVDSFSSLVDAEAP